MKEREILGIVTARGGSKSILRKNIRAFAGKPLIAWAISTLKESGVVRRVVVSTDDEEIGEVAKTYGAEVPFMRPKELAGDTTPTLPVLAHALSWLKENEGYVPHYVILLEPTAVGKRPFHVREVAEMMKTSGADSVFSVVEVPGVFSPHWQLNVADDGRVELFTGGAMKEVIRRRQDLPKTYFRSGSIYAFKPELLFSHDPSFYGNDVRACITDAKYALDIDTPEDWVVAEEAFKKIVEVEKHV